MDGATVSTAGHVCDSGLLGPEDCAACRAEARQQLWARQPNAAHRNGGGVSSSNGGGGPPLVAKRFPLPPVMTGLAETESDDAMSEERRSLSSSSAASAALSGSVAAVGGYGVGITSPNSANPPSGSSLLLGGDHSPAGPSSLSPATSSFPSFAPHHYAAPSSSTGGVVPDDSNHCNPLVPHARCGGISSNNNGNPLHHSSASNSNDDNSSTNYYGSSSLQNSSSSFPQSSCSSNGRSGAAVVAGDNSGGVVCINDAAAILAASSSTLAMGLRGTVAATADGATPSLVNSRGVHSPHFVRPAPLLYPSSSSSSSSATAGVASSSNANGATHVVVKSPTVPANSHHHQHHHHGAGAAGAATTNPSSAACSSGSRSLGPVSSSSLSSPPTKPLASPPIDDTDNANVPQSADGGASAATAVAVAAAPPPPPPPAPTLACWWPEPPLVTDFRRHSRYLATCYGICSYTVSTRRVCGVIAFSTAMYFIQRFVYCHGSEAGGRWGAVARVDPATLSAAAVFLATKAENFKVKLSSVVEIVFDCPVTDTERHNMYKMMTLQVEVMLLATLSGSLTILHPFAALLALAPEAGLLGQQANKLYSYTVMTPLALYCDHQQIAMALVAIVAEEHRRKGLLAPSSIPQQQQQQEPSTVLTADQRSSNEVNAAAAAAGFSAEAVAASAALDVRLAKLQPEARIATSLALIEALAARGKGCGFLQEIDSIVEQRVLAAKRARRTASGRSSVAGGAAVPTGAAVGHNGGGTPSSVSISGAFPARVTPPSTPPAIA